MEKNIKFSEMKYERIPLDEIKESFKRSTDELLNAKNADEAIQAVKNADERARYIDTMSTLCYIRHNIDTLDKFYDDETNYWNETFPLFKEDALAFTDAMLDSPFRKELSEEFGEIIFINAELEKKTFDESIVPYLQKEAKLSDEYAKLIASAQIPFDGGVYTLSQLTPFKNSSDDDVRYRAWVAEGNWYKENKEKLDDIYDELTSLRDTMGRKLSYDGFTELGYYRMQRNWFNKSDIEKFRENVIKYLVPVAEEIRKAQAKRNNKPYPLSYSDMQLEFPDGNPVPAGDAKYILNAGKKFYDELSKETSEFFNTMLDNELLDVLSKKGKAGGGFQSPLYYYKVPFIFANFNGTQGDVEIVTHEAGHAFEDYINEDRIPSSTVCPGMEGAEIHSMGMEFFAWPWAEDFFGKDKDKYLFSHLSSALLFIPYGTMVDHFQHIIYENPKMTKKERDAEWKRLSGIYMPWVRLDGDIPFYGEGMAWQRQTHIYEEPFYYIDYCLAQTVALEFWTLIQKDLKTAWEKYMAYTTQGGSDTVLNMLKKAGLKSPMEESVMKEVRDEAMAFLKGSRFFG